MVGDMKPTAWRFFRILACCLVCVWLWAAYGWADEGTRRNAAATATEGARRPMLVILNPVSDIGPVPEGDPVRHTIRFRNAGKGELRLLRLRRWKGTRVLHADETLAPGADGRIELELHTLNAGTRALKGVTIVTNENKAFTRRIALTLHSTPQIEADPDRLWLSGFVGQSLKKEIVIRGHLEIPLRLIPNTPVLQ